MIRPRIHLGWPLYVVGALAVLVLAIALMPLNWLRGPLAAWLGAKIERPVTLGGDLDLEWRWPPVLVANDVVVGNPPGFAGDFFRVAQARVAFAPLTLLGSRPRLPYVALREPVLALLRQQDGRPNWTLGLAQPEAGDAAPVVIDVGAIRVERGRVDIDDARLDAHGWLAVWSEGRGRAATVQFGGNGRYRGQPVVIGGRGEGLTELRNVDEPFALAFEAKAGTTRVRFDGTVQPGAPDNLQGTLALAGQDASRLYPVVPVPIPWTPPYSLKGTLNHVGGTWRYRDFAGRVGASDLSGNVAIDVSTSRPAVDADFASNRFDYRDLGGFVGLPPGRPGFQAASAEQDAARAKQDATGRVLPTTEYPLAKLREFDANVRFRGAHVRFDTLPFDKLDAKLALANGVLRVAPLRTSVGDGDIRLDLTLDANGDTAKSDARIAVRNVDLVKLFPSLASPRGTAGHVNGGATFTSTGNSIAAMLGSANGTGALTMSGGEASTLTLVLTNLDLARAGVLLLTGDKPSALHCAATSFELRDGVLVPGLFVIDTEAVTIDGAGAVDFARERYDLTLTSKSKKPSLLALHGPIEIDGTFAHPVVAPAPAPIALRLGAAAGLAALAPPLALLPFVDLGLAEDVDCAALLDARRAPPGNTATAAR